MALKKAGHLTSRVARDVFVTDLENIMDDGNSAGKTNAAVAADVTKCLENLDKFKIPPADQVDVDFTCEPLVQSGGQYNIHVTSPGLTSPDTKFSDDVIMYSAAMRYKQQTAIVGRTYFIDASPSQLRVYDALLEAEATLIDKLRPGAVIGEVVTSVRDSFLGRPGMSSEAVISKTFGSGIGVRVGDKYTALTAKNATVIEPGMVFGVCMGLYDIPLTDVEPAGRKTMGKIGKYGVLLADTVVVTSDGPIVVTDKASKERKDIVYMLGGEEEEGEEEEDGEDDEEAKRKRKERRAQEAAAAAADAAGRIGGRSSRLQARQVDSAKDEENRKQREEHQAALMAKQREAALKRKAGGGSSEEAAAEEDELERAAPIEAYQSSKEYPKSIRQCQIAVDKDHNCVLVPLFGTHVPFHINTIKSVAKSEEGHKAFLRLNFYAPAQALGKDVAPNMAAAVGRHPDNIFIRTLNIVSRDHRNLIAVEAQIKAMQKKVRKQKVGDDRFPLCGAQCHFFTCVAPSAFLALRFSPIGANSFYCLLFRCRPAPTARQPARRPT